MPEESPLERLRRLEAQDRAARDSQARPGAGAAPPGGQRGGRGAGLVTGGRRIIWKGKAILLFLLLKGKAMLAALKLGPILQTAGTMGLSAWIYAGFYGAPFAVGLVLLILIHELGHGFAARRMHLKVGAPIFIPFFGAVIALKEQPKSTWVTAVVSFGGPAAGLLASAAVLAIGLALEPGHARGFLIVLAWCSALINLFNLLPVFGLDGDGMTEPCRPWHWIPGILSVGALTFVGVETMGQVHPSLLFILLLGAFKGARTWWHARRARSGAGPKRLVDRLAQAEERYAEEATVEPWRRHAAAAAYFGLVAALSLLALFAQSRLPPLPR